MLRSAKILSCFIMLIALLSCSRAYNYTDAEGITEAGQSFIKLKGKRKPMAHDIASLFSNRTYEDSVLIAVPSLKDGIIKGKDIPVEKGHYYYTGELSINGNSLEVKLFYDNADDKKAETTSWNGKYNFSRK